MWYYEPDEVPKRKHHWDHDVAGVETVGDTRVSKCPSRLSLDDAAAMLNGGYEWQARRSTKFYPERIYAVRDGVVYRATPTNPGRSYHGFPELREKLPPGRALREAIIEMARDDGNEEQVRKWLQ